MKCSPEGEVSIVAGRGPVTDVDGVPLPLQQWGGVCLFSHVIDTDRAEKSCGLYLNIPEQRRRQRDWWRH